MTKLRLPFLPMVLALLQWPGSLAWSCTLELDGLSAIQMSELKNPTTVRVIIRKTGAACSFFVAASFGQSAATQRKMSNAKGEVFYNIYLDSARQRILKDLGSATAGDVYTGSFSNAGAESKEFDLTVAYQGVNTLEPGNYVDDVILSLYQGGFDATAPSSDSHGLHVSHFVPPMRKIAIVGAGATANPNQTQKVVNLGALTEPKTVNVDLLAWANSGYKILLSSQNGGRLRNQVIPSQSIPYELKIKGLVKDLGPTPDTVVDLVSTAHPSAVAGDRYPIAIHVAPARDVLAGEYQDILTVVVEGN